MSYADPQSVTISGAAVSLPGAGASLNEGRYQSSDGQVILTVQHQSGNRNRHVAKLAQAIIVADPLVPAQNLPVGFSAHLVVDGPRQGVTAAQLIACAKALVAWGTDANLAKLVGSEV